jgi:hypothetical protein
LSSDVGSPRCHRSGYRARRASHRREVCRTDWRSGLRSGRLVYLSTDKLGSREHREDLRMSTLDTPLVGRRRRADQGWARHEAGGSWWRSPLGRPRPSRSDGRAAALQPLVAATLVCDPKQPSCLCAANGW